MSPCLGLIGPIRPSSEGILVADYSLYDSYLSFIPAIHELHHTDILLA